MSCCYGECVVCYTVTSLVFSICGDGRHLVCIDCVGKMSGTSYISMTTTGDIAFVYQREVGCPVCRRGRVLSYWSEEDQRPRMAGTLHYNTGIDWTAKNYPYWWCMTFKCLYCDKEYPNKLQLAKGVFNPVCDCRLCLKCQEPTGCGRRCGCGQTRRSLRLLERNAPDAKQKVHLANQLFAECYQAVFERY